MELYEFISLPIHDRANTIWRQGVYLCTRSTKSGFVNLYGIDSFYAEVYYHAINNEVEDIRSFRSVDCLDPYFHLIHIDWTEVGL